MKGASKINNYPPLPTKGTIPSPGGGGLGGGVSQNYFSKNRRNYE